MTSNKWVPRVMIYVSRNNRSSTVSGWPFPEIGLREALMAVLATAATAGEGSAAGRFWISSKEEAIFASYSPFVVCLASGKLHMETFRNYIAQDVHFLKAFAQA
ncbi:hypothetical protein BHM03_00049065 [Ensete ventricosum]|nr:hypothetical protein BHM03_00049065 [Ensete ventricosum]